MVFLIVLKCVCLFTAVTQFPAHLIKLIKGGYRKDQIGGSVMGFISEVTLVVFLILQFQLYK